MSWLYTIVFTGIMFSSQPGTNIRETAVLAEQSSVAPIIAKIDESERFEQTYPLNANGRVNISNVNGDILVEGWDRSEVRLEYTKVADSKERLADVQVRIESRAESFSASVDYDQWKTRGGDGWKNGGKLNVEFKLTVPRGAVLNEIETVNGSVSVSNFTNITRVSAVNGSVSATNIRGTAKLSTVNGEVAADFDRLESGSRITLETVNGRVNLSIPSDSNATLKAESLNGVIANDFGLPVRKGKYVGRDMYGKIGSGEVQIKLESVNGGLTIKRKNDGRSPSPAVDLLPTMGKGDDWDMDDESRMIDHDKLNKEIAKATKASVKTTVSSKEAAKALARAENELRILEPQISVMTQDQVKRAIDESRMAEKLMKTEVMRERMAEGEIRRTAALRRITDFTVFPGVPRVEKKSDAFPVKGTPTVTVNGKGCSVTVRGWDKQEVQYRVVQFSNPRNQAPLNIAENHSDSSVTVSVENADDAARSGDFLNERSRVRIEVMVPRKSNLKIEANGEIRLDGVSGSVDLTGADESMNIRDVEGTLKIASSDGRVRVVGFTGDLDAVSSSGSLNLEGDFTSLQATSADGSVLLTIPDATSAEVQSSSPDITGEGFELTKTASGHYRLGSGSRKFRIGTEGSVVVRSSSALRETN